MQYAIVFDRQSREVCIGNQIAQRIPAPQYLLKDRPMLIGRLNDAHARLVEPTLNTFDGFFESEWTLMQSGVSANANEGTQHRPAQTDWI